MGKVYTRSNLIASAASFVRADMLTELFGICETQKTISTRKLGILLDKIEEDMKIHGIHLREYSKLID